MEENRHDQSQTSKQLRLTPTACPPSACVFWPLLPSLFSQPLQVFILSSCSSLTYRANQLIQWHREQQRQHLQNSQPQKSPMTPRYLWPRFPLQPIAAAFRTTMMHEFCRWASPFLVLPHKNVAWRARKPLIPSLAYNIQLNAGVETPLPWRILARTAGLHVLEIQA